MLHDVVYLHQELKGDSHPSDGFYKRCGFDLRKVFIWTMAKRLQPFWGLDIFGRENKIQTFISGSIG